MRIAFICGVALGCYCSMSNAADVRVVSGACGEPVRVVARDAPLSLVLKRLGESVGFALVYQTERDPLITLDRRASPLELVRDLAEGMNFSVEHAADRRCANEVRVAKVSLLSDRTGKSNVAKPNAYTPEMERIARQGALDYLRSHGFDDQTIESMAVK